MQVGQVVKFREVLEPNDAVARYVVLEVQGDRVMVSPVHAAFDGWKIRPVMTYRVTDMV